jgi:AAA+ ATPase superfamily predicted ATPase
VSRFIDRERELEFLEEKFNSDERQLIVIYGRRRLGKTELIKQFCKDKDHIYFLADRRGSLLNAERFANIAAEFFGDVPPKVRNFDDVFTYIAIRLNKRKIVTVIDEFSYLVEKDDSIPSVFQLIWDEVLKDKNIMLILCGSLVSMMESILSYRSPLYGRRTGQWKLSPLRFNQAKQFFPNYSTEQRVVAYSILGGIPFYLNTFDDRKDIYVNIEEKILTKGEVLYEEVEFLLREELRDYSSYLSILEAIARGNSRLSEIANFSKIQAKDLPKYLNVLIRLDIVEKVHPITEKRATKKTIYKIKDNFFDFYFRFVYPYKSDLELGNVKKVMGIIKKDFNTFIGKKFEDVSRGFLYELSLKGLTPFKLLNIGTWWEKDEEIDIVAFDREGKRILFCEAKWQDLDESEAERILERLKKKASVVKWFNAKRKEYFCLIGKRLKDKKDLREKGYLVFDLEDFEKIGF